MKKLTNKSKNFLKEYKSGGDMPKAQRGIGFRAYDPYKDVDNQISVLKSAGASYLGAKTFNDAYFNSSLRDDPDRAQRLSQRSSTISGLLGGINSAFSMVGEARDYKIEMQRIAERRAMQYNRVPYDRYAYNEQNVNAYNNTAYQRGGSVKHLFAPPHFRDDMFVKDLNSVNRIRSLGQSTYRPDYTYTYDQNQNQSHQNFIYPFTPKNNMGILDTIPVPYMNRSLATPSKHTSTDRFRERKMGGRTLKYQDGGMVEDAPPDDGPIVYDSTQGFFDNTALSFDNYEPKDIAPLINDEIDYSNIRPSIGGMPLSSKPLSNDVKNILDHLYSKMNIRPSSTNTGKHNEGSRHYHGEAFDLGLNKSFGGSMQKLQDFKADFIKQQATNPLYRKFKLVDESVRPKGQKVWEGAHLHVELAR